MPETYDPIPERPAFGTPAEIERAPDRALSRGMPAGFEVQHEVAPDRAPSSVMATIEAAGIPHDVIRTTMEWLNSDAPNATAEDEASRLEARTELVNLWGEKYLENVAKINAYIDSLPADAADVLRHGRRTGDRPAASDPAILQRLLGLANQRKVSLSTEGDVGEQIATIEKFMRANRRAYNADVPLQARLRDLYRIREAT
jgi:hypothetical protein